VRFASLVRLFGAVEVAMIAGLLSVQIATLAHRTWMRRWDGRARDVRRDLIAAVAGGSGEWAEPASGTLDRLSQLPLAHRLRLIIALAQELGGTERALLVPIAERAGLIGPARSWLRSHRWAKRLRGVTVLMALGLDDPGLDALFADRRAQLRAAAVRWAMVVRPWPEAARSIGRLAGDRSGRVCHAVAESLIGCGAAAVPVLTSLLDSNDPTVLDTALRAAFGIDDPMVHLAAQRALASPSSTVRVLAVRALGPDGPDWEQAQRRSLLADPCPSVRAAAAGSVDAVGGVVDLAPLLFDVDRDVRAAVTGTLVRLGPVGDMVLRVRAEAMAADVDG